MRCAPFYPLLWSFTGKSLPCEAEGVSPLPAMGQ